MIAAPRQFCLLALFAIAFTSAPAAEPSPVPKRFSAYIGGFMGARYKVELHDGTLTYTSSGPGHGNQKTKTITPTETQWRDFRQALDDLEVWQWHTDYPNKRLADGTQWSLDIAFDDRALNTHGSNNYPDEGGKSNGKADPTKIFNKYLGAVQKLLGGEAFR